MGVVSVIFDSYAIRDDVFESSSTRPNDEPEIFHSSNQG